MHFCITGGSRGLGEALAKHILLNNHRVTIIDRVKPTVACRFIHHDFATDLHASVSCDVLIVNHATFDGFIPFKNRSSKEVKEYLQVNLLSQIDLIKSCRYNKLVYINSVLSIASFPNISMYSACKAFMHSFLESVRKEGTSILSVYPYKIDTDLFKDVRSPYVLKKKKISKEIYNSIIKNDTHLYLPGIFRCAYIYMLLPFFVQNWLAKIIYYFAVKE